MNDDPWQAVRNVLTRAIEAAVAGIGALALIVIIGMVIDARSKHSEQLDSCLKNATNDAEIERCNY